MAELMTHGADAQQVGGAVALPAVDFGGAGIAAQAHAVDLPPHVGHVGPQVIVAVAAIIGAVSGHDKVDHVDIAVAIGIVIGKIHLVVDGVECGFENQVRFIAALLARVVDIHWPHDIKLRVELSHGILIEIVAHGTGALHKLRGSPSAGDVVAAVAPGVEHVGVKLLCVGALEFLVGVLDKNHKPAEAGPILGRAAAADDACVAVGAPGFPGEDAFPVGQVLSLCAEQLCVACCAVLCVACDDPRRHQPAVLLGGVSEPSVPVAQHGVAVGSGSVVIELVAHELHGDGVAVGLSHAGGRRVGRHCTGPGCHGECCRGRKQSFCGHWEFNFYCIISCS